MAFVILIALVNSGSVLGTNGGGMPGEPGVGVCLPVVTWAGERDTFLFPCCV